MYGGSLRAGPHKTTVGGCGAQTNPTPDLTLTLTLTLTPTLTPTQPFGGLEVCSRGRQGQY